MVEERNCWRMKIGSNEGNFRVRDGALRDGGRSARVEAERVQRHVRRGTVVSPAWTGSPIQQDTSHVGIVAISNFDCNPPTEVSGTIE